MKVLLTGGSGLLGRALVPEFEGRGHEVHAPARVDFDLLAPEGWPTSLAPHVIVNLAAYTAVDRAESEPDAAFALNAIAPVRLAAFARRIGARFVHLSTDYVFDGEKRTPYTPGDERRPLNVYGASKAAGEDGVLHAGGDPLIVRTSWLYGIPGRGFVDTVLRAVEDGRTLTVVNDQVGSPTSVGHLAAALVGLIERGATGVHHLANAGAATWFDLAVAAVEEGGFDPSCILPVTSEKWGAPARRPHYSVLDTSASFAFLGGAPATWREALREYLQRREGLSYGAF